MFGVGVGGSYSSGVGPADAGGAPPPRGASRGAGAAPLREAVLYIYIYI